MARIKVDSAQQALEGTAVSSFAQRAATPLQNPVRKGGHVLGLRTGGDKLAEADIGDESPVLE